MQEKHKDDHNDVEINGHKFRIGLVSARDGSWTVNAVTGGKYHDPDVYARIEGIMLSACTYIRPDGQPLLLYKAGKFLVPDLDIEYDTCTVTLLVEEAMRFNTFPTIEKLIERQKKEIAEAEAAEAAKHTKP